MRQISQANRLFHLDTPLGEDKLLVRTFDGTETISDNFHFELLCASEDFDIDFEQILGKTITVGLKQSDGSSLRYFNGYVKKFQQVHAPGRLAHYHAEIVPWLWFLTLTQDCRIFQNMSVPDIMEDVFQRFGFQDYEIDVAEHDEWEYCVQYRETAFNFLNRLMEIEGIYYYFKHADGKHTMVIIDDLGSHENCPYESTYRFDRVTGPGYKHGPDTVYHWIPQKHVQPGKYSHKEYNYETPDDPMYADMDAQTDAKPNPKWEIYDYPGDYDVHNEADEWVRWRIQEQEVDYETSRGSSNCRSMVAGYKFDLTEHYRQDQNQSYLVRSVTHKAREGTLIGGSDAQEASYENTFTSMPADVQYRKERKTTKPVMKGSQTAFVTGPAGEEIYTDDKGRVKVKFHWDRINPGDENSSCWIRIMQQWTGKHWGQIWIPRIGQEVIVDFLEGDPDRPLITGCVYNQDNQPPYKLPDNKTVSGFQSRSSKGGGDQNYNEFKIEDKSGEEMINIQAEKDMNTLVKHDQTLTVKHDKTSTIEHDMATTVMHDKTVEVDHDLSIDVKHDLTLEVDNLLDLTIKSDQRIGVTGSRNLTVKGDQKDSIQGTRSLQIQGDDQTKISGKMTIQAGGDLTIKTSGKIILQGMGGVTLMGGSGFIDIGEAAITIQGTTVLINCGSPPPGPAADASPQDPDKPKGFDPQASSPSANSPAAAGGPVDSAPNNAYPSGGSSGSGGASGSGGSSSGSAGPDAGIQPGASSGASPGGGSSAPALSGQPASGAAPGGSSSAGPAPLIGPAGATSSGAAPAGSSGPANATVTETYSPGVTITGSQAFVAQTRAALDKLKSTPTGAAVLNSIGSSGKAVGINQFADNNGQTIPANLNAANLNNGMPGSGSDSIIKFNPAFTPGGLPNALVLGHEMMHAMHSAYGMRATGLTGGVKNEELQTVGLPPYPATGLTENSLRKDLGIPPREQY